MLPRLLESSAIISECGRFRYVLRRVWDRTKPILVVCMLNPSTADANKNDPTILQLIWFAKNWGYGGIHIVNLFALRTSKPQELLAHKDRQGPQNAEYLHAAMLIVKMAAQTPPAMLVAWGNGGDLDQRHEWFTHEATQVYGLTLICLGETQNCSPKHPMARGKHRIPRAMPPKVWINPKGFANV